jgi:hypothetical protein
VVVRDATAEPSGRYDVCYVNGFQTQPGDAAHWLDEHPDLVLRDAAGEPVADPDWPDEYLLDISDERRRMELAALLGTVIASCATNGFDAVEIDNLDSFARSGGAFGIDDAIDLAARYAEVAHDLGLAIGQKNTAEHAERLRSEVGFDFVIAEECGAWDECDAYTDVYGDLVFDVEYDDAGLEAACAVLPNAILRDLDLTVPGGDGYRRESCG